MIYFNDVWYPGILPPHLQRTEGFNMQHLQQGRPIMMQPPYMGRIRRGPTIVELQSSRGSTSTGGDTFYYSSANGSRGNYSSSSSKKTSGWNIYEQASDSGGSVPASRPWRLVNQDVSQRMLAAVSDSPPQIPKRETNHRHSRPPRGRARSTALDSSTEDSLEGESSHPGQGQVMSDLSNGHLVPFNGSNQSNAANNEQTPSPYYYYGGTGTMSNHPQQPPFPGPQPPPQGMWPPQMGPPFMDEGGHPMPPCPPFMGPPPPMGPPPCFFDEQGRPRMEAMENNMPLPPPQFMMPPHTLNRPSVQGTNSEHGDMSMALVPFGGNKNNDMQIMPFYPRPPYPFMPPPPPPMMHMHPMMMPPPPPIFMPPPPSSKEYGDIERMIKRKGDMEMSRTKKKDKESACYIVCCKGHTQVLWIIIAIVLIGVVLGLVLGLTLV